MWWIVCFVFGLHSWWDSGDGELVCLDCGRVRRTRISRRKNYEEGTDFTDACSHSCGAERR